MKSVKIVYGSCGGNTELACKIAAGQFEKRGYQVTLLSAKNRTYKDVGDFDLLVLASPTYGHGELERYFGMFLSSSADWDLEGKDVAIIGLGDRKYDADYHFESARTIERYLVDKKANLVGKPLMLNGSIVLQINRVELWVDQLL
ncbi:hypothetical protein CVV38_01025 [Candidatus Peregrinibacteria bacterium HGW-Peregrinibacteria-1]|jgi:flavodoxin I|nr:MAG: hypothetical protein CVV38_01025 [Candidatus Peregrinibacteria bacterium HGW-Peregrinibacteria-1]